ncbi:MAG: hypothetical protein HYW69_03090 [Candidatus Nealsonbacteria bacterium]|nr:hypothetical protein [Candidatus Nealsonbacteria bacterium]
MTWLLLAILAYFFLAIVSLFDRYFLVGPTPSPKVYTFNVAILWMPFSLLLIPFGLNLPTDWTILLVALASGLTRVFAILFLMQGIIKSEVSRIVPANGALLPIFSFLLFLLFLKTDSLGSLQILAFLLLLAGSVLISIKKFTKEFISFHILKYPIISAFLFALSFLATKQLFLKTDFLSGFFLTLMAGAAGGLLFLLSSGARKEIFTQKTNVKISSIFILGQILGGLGVVAQFYAIFLASANQVPLINALEGTRYIFLMFFIFLLSRWNSHLLKEEMKGAALIQKIAAVLLIIAGLAVLAA